MLLVLTETVDIAVGTEVVEPEDWQHGRCAVGLLTDLLVENWRLTVEEVRLLLITPLSY